jgi:hypothetical protein
MDREEPAGDPSGHLSTTAADMSRFMRALLGQGLPGGVRLLQPASIAAMQGRAFAPFEGGYGASQGFFHSRHAGRTVLAHPGDLSGFHADLRLLPEEGVGWFIGLNSDGAPNGIVEKSYALRESLFDAFLERYFPVDSAPQEPTTPTAPAHAALATGEYEMSRQGEGHNFFDALYLLFRVRVTANPDGTIETPPMLSFVSAQPRTWREVAPFEWREVDGNARLYMEASDDRVTSFLPDDLFSFELLRVPFHRSATLNVPLLIYSFAVLALTAIAWPLAAWRRRRLGLSLDLGRTEGRLRLFALGAGVLGLTYWLGWVAVIVAGVPSQLGQEGWIRLVQGIGVGCVIGAAVAIVHAVAACMGPRGIVAKGAAIVLALALVSLAWLSIVLHLITYELNF